MTPSGHGSWLIPLLAVLFIAWRLRRNKASKVRVKRIFWLPVIIAVLTVLTLRSAPVPSPAILWLLLDVVALFAGVVAGFLSAHHQEFTLDYDTGTITSRATPFGSILVAVFFAAEFGLRLLLPDVFGSPFSVWSYLPGPPIPEAPHNGAAWIMGWTDAGLIFSAAMLLLRAFTMWLRAQPLVAAHKEHVMTRLQDQIGANGATTLPGSIPPESRRTR